MHSKHHTWEVYWYWSGVWKPVINSLTSQLWVLSTLSGVLTWLTGLQILSRSVYTHMQGLCAWQCVCVKVKRMHVQWQQQHLLMWLCLCLNGAGRLHGGLAGRIVTRWPQRGEIWQRKLESLLLMLLKNSSINNKPKISAFLLSLPLCESVVQSNKCAFN